MPKSCKAEREPFTSISDSSAVSIRFERVGPESTHHVGELRREDVHVIAEQGRVEVEVFRVGVERVFQTDSVQVKLVIWVLVTQPSVLCKVRHNESSPNDTRGPRPKQR